MNYFNKQKNISSVYTPTPNLMSGFTLTPKLSNKANLVCGFTLVELMVATSIFIIIMLVIMGSLVTVSDTSKKSQALQQAMDNVNFAVDNISRTLRISTNYACVTNGGSVNLSIQAVPVPADCPLGGPNYGSLVEFMPPTNLNLTPLGYPMAYEAVSRGDGTTTLQRCTKDGCTDIVASNVDVKMLRFYVRGSLTTDSIQPSVYIIMKGVITIKGVPTSFAVQTFASQRSTE